MSNIKANALLLDFLPYELPLLFSNINIYELVKSNSDWITLELEEKFQETQSYQFSIFKNEFTNRELSLMHPLAQLQCLKFIEIYDMEILNYFNLNSIFSIRYPYKLNSINQKHINKIESEMKFIFDEEVEINNNEYEKYMDSYFLKKKYKKITDFYKSNLFKKLETKYSLLQKLDISNCFYNIYTHSIDWAYLGNKEIAKKDKQGKRLSTKLDSLMMSLNYSETNGIIVGPEFSRIVAEIVLTRIDRIVYEKLMDYKIIYKVDYEVVRYIDDIFIFANSNQNLEKIKRIYIDVCEGYKLSINEAKAYMETVPFLKKHNWVVKIKKILQGFFKLFDNPINLDKTNINRSTNQFLMEVRAVIIEFESEKHSIVSFVLSAIERVWRKSIANTINQINDVEIKKYFLFKFVDFSHYLLSLSLITPNIIKYSKLAILVKYEASKLEDVTIENLIFNKTLEIIKYHNYKGTEIINLIILLKHFEKEIPENLLIKIIQNDANYFNLAAVSYYIDEKSRVFKYKRAKNIINEEVEQVIQFMNEEYILPSTDKKKLKRLVSNSKFYIVHDFYTSNVINKKVKKKVKTIHDKIFSINWDGKDDKFFKFFLECIRDFEKPFMNWSATEQDMIKILIEKTLGQNQSY